MMMKNKYVTLLAGFSAILLASTGLRAVETENLNIQVLPTSSKVVVDGKSEDWNLAGGVYACGDVETLRGKMGVWIHTQYDADNLYILARWDDETPLSNPGSIAGDYGWQGDCLQLRIIADPDKRVTTAKGEQPLICWVTAWQDRDGKDVIDLDFPNKGMENLKDAQTQGAEQAFTVREDGKGYVQEISIPWALLTAGGIKPTPGGRINFSVEPNFNTTSSYRITIKDIFRPGIIPDRAFTFSSFSSWGFGTFMQKGPVQPQKLRLADRREFDVTMVDGQPEVAWDGLFEEKKMLGFEKIKLDMPEDGYVSMNILNSNGQVVRQILTADHFSRGEHEILWDGLTNMSHLQPGDPVDAGDYTWEAIYHTGLGLRLVGWADNSGRTPYDSADGNWGGDHGVPTAITTAGNSAFLGWTASEAGKGLVCTDLEGNVKWRQKRGGFGGASDIAVGNGIVYVADSQQDGTVLYRVSEKSGEYIPWEGSDSAVLPINPGLAGLGISGTKLYLSVGNEVLVLDAATGKKAASIAVPEAGDLEVGSDGAVYVLAGGKQVLRLAENGSAKTVVQGLNKAQGLAVGADGAIYVGVGDPDNQVQVFNASGKLVRSIGKSGGRQLTGAWQANGMRFIDALSVDQNNVLWVAEKDDTPKRFSCWNAATGEFVREFFGPTAYGATGGSICPTDPTVMVGSGCEWKLDPETGKASCVGVILRGGVHTSRFGQGPDGRVYVAFGKNWSKPATASIYERIGTGQYKLRTRLDPILGDRQSGMLVAGARIWSDANGDEKEQAQEVHEDRLDLGMWLANWYMPMTQTMIFYGGSYRIEPTGWTACGAPEYDLSKATRLPAPSDFKSRGVGMGVSRTMGSADGKLVIYNGRYGLAHSDFACYDIASGKQLWTYPNNYVGVHGGHLAPPAHVGLIRGAYDIVGTGKLADPIGDVFLIATDKGEWHILTGAGYYLSRLFEGDPMKIQWPEKAVPGAIMDNVPPGAGSEDFGGSMVVTDDGSLYVQAGKTAFVNMQVVGLDSVKKLTGGKLQVSNEEVTLAKNFREQLLQQSVGALLATAKKKSILFTGDIKKDFGADDLLAFQKSPKAAVIAAIAYDDNNLYLGWQVNDDTPWINGAPEPAEMYAGGDTVDFQLGTNPDAAPDRNEAVLGDLRLSIGDSKGKPTAVIYRRVATDKHPRKFFSGIARDGYEMQSVVVLDQAKIEVKRDDRAKTYTVEAAIPLSALGFKPTQGLKLRGDIGVTHGNQAGDDTLLRTYWNNQETGIVADEVYELKMQPKNWGYISFQ